MMSAQASSRRSKQNFNAGFNMPQVLGVEDDFKENKDTHQFRNAPVESTTECPSTVMNRDDSQKNFASQDEPSESFFVNSDCSSNSASLYQRMLRVPNYLSDGTQSEIMPWNNPACSELLHQFSQKYCLPLQKSPKEESIMAKLKNFIKTAFLLEDKYISTSELLLCQSLSKGLNSCAPKFSSDSLEKLPFGFENEIQSNHALKFQCFNQNCLNISCTSMQECLETLKAKSTIQDLSLYEKCVLWNMYYHCCNCHRLHCPLYWCQKEAIKWSGDVLVRMKELVTHGYNENFLEDLKTGCFVKFDKHLPFNKMPEEKKDWVGLIRMSGAQNTILASPKAEAAEKYWVLKKSPMFQSRSQMELFESLRHLSHGLVSYLWACFSPDTHLMAVCMPYHAFSLQDRLQNNPIKKHPLVIQMMGQMINVTRYMHISGILYLNWSSKNIVYDSPDHLLLTNFTSSVLKSKKSQDLKDVMLSLPCHLLVPEMFDSTPDVDESSDVWGLGCLLKEIFSGQPVWSECCQETEDALQEKIQKMTPEIPDDASDLLNVFKACWERDRLQRANLDEFQDLLLAANKGTSLP